MRTGGSPFNWSSLGRQGLVASGREQKVAKSLDCQWLNRQYSSALFHRESQGLNGKQQLGDEAFMRLALAEANAAAAQGEIPVGAVAVKDGLVVGLGHNRREGARDPTAHAELLAIQAAARSLGAWRLSGVTLYVTLEPCAMCAGASVLARIDRMVFGTKDPKAGAAGSLMNLLQDIRLNHRMDVTDGVLEKECSDVLKTFFRDLRRSNG